MSNEIVVRNNEAHVPDVADPFGHIDTRIAVPTEDPAHPLRPGMSVGVTIRVK